MRRTLLTTALLSLLLTGCGGQQMHGTGEPPPPAQQVADYLMLDCGTIWRVHGEEVAQNPLYWLRGIDCARHLSSAQALNEAQLRRGNNWQDTWLRAIVLDKTGMSVTERQRYLNLMEGMQEDVPVQVQPVLHLWFDNQMQQLALADEYERYNQLAQSTGSELDALRQQQQALRSQLTQTTRKLESLTDIERQLSTRKPGAAWSSGHSSGKNNTSDDDQDITTPGREKTQ